MICIIAGNKLEAQRFADGQLWDKEDWFYPEDIVDLYKRKNFHVIVTGSAGLNVPPTVFERLYKLARQRGKMR